MTGDLLHMRISSLAGCVAAITADDYRDNAVELFDIRDAGDLQRAAKVIKAAERFVALVVECRRLKLARVAIECVNEAIVGDDVRPGTPCWKDRSEPSGREGEPDTTRPQLDWCEPCRQRQVVHDQYRAAVRARGAASRSLQKLAGVR